MKNYMNFINRSIDVIGICGKKRAGKDTIASIITKHIPNSYTYHMASPLKKSCQILFDLSQDQLYGDQKEEVDERWGLSPRQIFQKVGTDMLRNNFTDKLFVIHLDHILKYNNNLVLHQSSNKTLILIPDIRFQNEIDYIKERWQGSVIRVVRGQGFDDPHPSESDILKLSNIDFEVDNSSSLFDLEVNIVNFLKQKRLYTLI